MPNKTSKHGFALIVVLFIVMAITILSLGFLSRSSTASIAGNNMEICIQTGYLAESGLDHARSLILNPQDIATGYWTGATAQQLVTGSDDYYDVSVTKLGELNYRINSTGYKLRDSEQIGRSSLQAELRLDPCIALWTGSSAVTFETVINGDVYCSGNLAVNGQINGDASASGDIFGTNVTGRISSRVSSPPLGLPGLNVLNFSSQYYYNNSGPYSVGIVAPGVCNELGLGPNPGNPAGVYYCNGTLDLTGNTFINGMLVVKDDLRIWYGAPVSITAVKNFPALLVGHDITMESNNSNLTVTGLAQVGNHIDMQNKFGGRITISGALVALGDGIKNTMGCTCNITVFPNKAAIETWGGSGNVQRWSPAVGTIFKSIKRQ